MKGLRRSVLFLLLIDYLSLAWPSLFLTIDKSPAKSQHFSWLHNRVSRCKPNRFSMSTARYPGLSPSQANSWSQRSSMIKAPCQVFIPSDVSHPSSTCTAQQFARHRARGPLRHRWNRIVGRTHLGKNFIQPLERAMQVYLNPAGGASNILPVVFSSPTLGKGKHRVINSLIWVTQPRK